MSLFFSGLGTVGGPSYPRVLLIVIPSLAEVPVASEMCGQDMPAKLVDLCWIDAYTTFIGFLMGFACVENVRFPFCSQRCSKLFSRCASDLSNFSMFPLAQTNRSKSKPRTCQRALRTSLALVAHFRIRMEFHETLIPKSRTLFRNI